LIVVVVDFYSQSGCGGGDFFELLLLEFFQKVHWALMRFSDAGDEYFFLLIWIGFEEFIKV